MRDLAPLRIPADTTPRAAHVQMQVFRHMPPRKRLRMTLALGDSLRAIVASGIRARHPEFTDAEVKLALTRLILGDELFQKVYPSVQVPR